ncbi:uncharacterized protein PGTG_21059 [Puccinia graminis f. sp. tritici CRL 75-36-700-3]|uniref:Uncharacterized protein n=1 Tax=Puccinia graminis f. sp. tritici (strain CRL 75-36-700-3 / race SCCL) TaxID=418459 RepID=H6QQ86_PUCGT|nr:uncharacterized protein PGTG_21059 [Puccinia graminis f. sp. tritici CRL 75-36-700-3]EHS64801.1 hypothetical protein PGTG_21059 [Puccinia graminis f. sp. tritici CRL 75-36-700-3]
MNPLPNTLTPPITLDEPARRIGWNRDGVAGGPSSIQLLLLWITAGANYTQWFATPFHRQDRENACTEIQQFMRTQGNIHRDPRGTRSYSTGNRYSLIIIKVSQSY